MRLLQTDSSYIALSDIYDQHCANTGISREDANIMAGEKARQVVRDFRQSEARSVSQHEIAADNV